MNILEKEFVERKMSYSSKGKMNLLSPPLSKTLRVFLVCNDNLEEMSELKSTFCSQ